MDKNQYIFKTALQTFGALRPQAWDRILQLQQKTLLKTNQSLIRKEGTLAYISEGLLKEYDSENRETPSIINFIGSGQYLLTRKYNQHHYLKACITTQVMYWDFEALMQLYQEFRELIQIYNAVCASYDQSIAYRQFVFEANNSQQRIQLFRAQFHQHLNYLKKKDIANYLQLNYTYFLHINAHI